MFVGGGLGIWVDDKVHQWIKLLMVSQQNCCFRRWLEELSHSGCDMEVCVPVPAPHPSAALPLHHASLPDLSAFQQASQTWTKSFESLSNSTPLLS